MVEDPAKIDGSNQEPSVEESACSGSGGMRSVTWKLVDEFGLVKACSLSE